jgi:predicted nucleotidyltransferase
MHILNLVHMQGVGSDYGVWYLTDAHTVILAQCPGFRVTMAMGWYGLYPLTCLGA